MTYLHFIILITIIMYINLNSAPSVYPDNRIDDILPSTAYMDTINSSLPLHLTDDDDDYRDVDCDLDDDKCGVENNMIDRKDHVEHDDDDDFDFQYRYDGSSLKYDTYYDLHLSHDETKHLISSDDEDVNSVDDDDGDDVSNDDSVVDNDDDDGNEDDAGACCNDDHDVCDDDNHDHDDDKFEDTFNCENGVDTNDSYCNMNVSDDLDESKLILSSIIIPDLNDDAEAVRVFIYGDADGCKDDDGDHDDCKDDDKDHCALAMASNDGTSMIIDESSSLINISCIEYKIDDSQLKNDIIQTNMHFNDNNNYSTGDDDDKNGNVNDDYDDSKNGDVNDDYDNDNRDYSDKENSTSLYNMALSNPSSMTHDSKNDNNNNIINNDNSNIIYIINKDISNINNDHKVMTRNDTTHHEQQHHHHHHHTVPTISAALKKLPSRKERTAPIVQDRNSLTSTSSRSSSSLTSTHTNMGSSSSSSSSSSSTSTRRESTKLLISTRPTNNNGISATTGEIKTSLVLPLPPSLSSSLRSSKDKNMNNRSSYSSTSSNSNSNIPNLLPKDRNLSTDSNITTISSSSGGVMKYSSYHTMKERRHTYAILPKFKY